MSDATNSLGLSSARPVLHVRENDAVYRRAAPSRIGQVLAAPQPGSREAVVLWPGHFVERVDVGQLAKVRNAPPPPLELDLTWFCVICGQERPDEAIGVTHQPLPGAEDRFPSGAHFNVRHCIDRPACVLVASRRDWQRLRDAVRGAP